MSPCLRKPGMEARDFSRVRLHDTIDSIFSDETGTKSGTESGTHPELPLESEGLNESDLDWF